LPSGMHSELRSIVHNVPGRLLHMNRYILTQNFAGALCRAYGATAVLIGAVLVWSSMTILTPLAAYHSTSALIATRVIMGLGEGLSQPVIHQVRRPMAANAACLHVMISLHADLGFACAATTAALEFYAATV
jgi:MFS family permease